MRPLLVVFDFPPIGGFPNLVQVTEQIQTEDFISISFVETLDICILIRLSRLNVLNRHPMFFSPRDELTTEELRPVICPQRFGQSTLQAEPLEDADQSFAGNRSVDLNIQQFSV